MFIIIEKRRLGDILVSAGKINTFQLQEALNNQRILGKKLGEILVDSKIISEDDIIEAIVTQTGIKSIDLNEVEFDKRVIKLVNENLCNKYTLVPFGFNGTKIKVALSDPLNIYAIDDISISTSCEVESYIASKSDIQKCVEINYSTEHVKNAAEELTRETSDVRTLNDNIDEFSNVKSAPAVKMVEYLFRNSVEMRASDIHIEPYKDEIRIRYRIDGELQTVNTLGVESLAPLVTRIKILAGLNIAEKRIPQDGRILIRIGNNDVDLRVSILPVVTGEKVVIRILNRSNYSLNRDMLEMSKKNLEKLDNIISSPNGIILVTGPTGSGKSTTLYTVLNELNSNNVNIVTVEDPVEYTLDGINQVNVNAKTGMTFANSLKSILRQDPDIIMIGEVRDAETAQIAIKAAVTGHLVLTTLHTNDAPSSIARLIDMGVEPYLIATSLAGVVAQRLVRKICTHCKEGYEASEYEKKMLIGDLNKELILYRGKGCGYCNNTGYIGRVGIYEIMEITREHRDEISMKATTNKIKDIGIKNGMTTLGQECKSLVLDGITTVSELLTITLLKDL